MSFKIPEMLFLVWVIPALALTYWFGGRRRAKILEVFAWRRGLARIVPKGLDRRRRWRAVLVLAACALLAAAVAGPQYGFRWQKIERKGVDIVIALDCSRSMLVSDIQPTRLDRAKREIYDLLTMLQGDRVGLVAFSGTAFLQCPLTIDYTAFYLFLDVLTPDYLPLGGSDLAAAVSVSQQAFNPQSKADRAIILITDGENTGSGDPMKAVKAAQASDIKLFCIGVGSNDGVPIPASDGGFKKDAQGQIVLTRLDEPLLTRMATATGGAYVRSVAGDMDLEAVYNDQIRAQMDRTTVESSRKKVWADRYQWPLALAVLLLLGSRWVPLLKKSVVVLLMVAAMVWPAASPAPAGSRQKGYEAYQAEKFDDALAHFTKAQVQEPNDPAVLYNLGNTLYKKQDFAGAAEHYRQALPHASDALKSRLLYNLGNTAFRQGALQEAIKNYEAALKTAPDDRQAQDNLAFVKQQLKQQKQQQQKDQQDQQKQQQQQQQSDSQSDSKKDQQQESSDNQDQQKQNQASQAPQGQDQQQAQAPPRNEPEMENQNQDRPQPEDQQPQKAESRGAQPQDQARQQGRQPEAQLLNRLKDQPGRAMMPNYQEKEVDKDW